MTNNSQIAASGPWVSALLAVVMFCAAFSGEAKAPVAVPVQVQTPPFNADSLIVRYFTYSQWCSPEKLYLHIDRAYYRAGETIWFAAYLKNASAYARFAESNFIYVELLNKKGAIENRVKVKRGNDGFAGYMELPDYTTTGNYTLRAYTQWQLNNGPEYMFNQQIFVSGQPNAKAPASQASVRSGNNVWNDDFSGREKDKSKVDGIKKVDVSFYPEGGRYFAGQKAVIAFKAMTMDGMPVCVKGAVVSSAGDTVTVVQTTHAGMGKMVLCAEKGRTYALVTEDGLSFELPSQSESGCSLSMNVHGDYLFINAMSMDGGTYSIFLRNSGELHPLATSRLSSSPSWYKILSNNVKPGINGVILVDKDGRIVAERLFYKYDEAPVKAGFTPGTVKKDAPRALIRSLLQLKNAEGMPIDGQFSVSVTKASLEEWHQNSGIAAYMNLGSELKGYIDEPDQYFDETIPLSIRKTRMDMLMLVQGWRYYNLGDPAKGPLSVKYLKEYVQKVTGKIKRTLSSKLPGKFIFSVIIPRLKFTRIVDAQKVRSFTIDSLDFEEGTSFIVSTTRPNALLDYIPEWDGENLAPKYRYMSTLKASINDGTASALDYMEEVRDTLDAALVTASVVAIPFADKVPAHDMEFFANRTLIEYLRIKYPIFVYTNGLMHNRRSFSPSVALNNLTEDSTEEEVSENLEILDEAYHSKDLVKLIIDDTEWEWWIFENVNLEDIASIYVSREPDLRFDAEGGLVIVKMKSPEAMPRNNQSRPSVLCFVPLGYQYPQYFYSPRYDRGNPDDGYDHRSTLLWNPCIKVKGGRALIEFCDSDQLDHPYSVRIEGMTSDGKPFSCRGQL